ncbi:hypothetical protein LF1_44790 [Rubripirellula obstinata]|uniref:Uncharacterized protein n=1 Tax=Rubripirellula obstinata TaxID=406547 RepID=A0A5B1CLH0_9BACT|nr:hypothetical protein [Rubripirellula obstinata]KAA1261918.1 hypothetical protein LF1_44790 [Rubripirellula obstinata]
MESQRNEPRDDRPRHYRPHLIVVFAIVMVWLASNANADQMDGSLLPTLNTIQLDATHSIASDHPALWQRDGNRPVSVDLKSALANFDADASPDGWRASVVIRDANANPVIMRSMATFTLVPRLALWDRNRFMDSDTEAMTWSMQLRFDEHGVANVTLPLRRSLESNFGWSSAGSSFPFDSISSRSRNHERFRSGNIAISRVYSSNRRRSVGGISYTRVDVPSTGMMRVRVSVPTEGVFEAETMVRLRPANFVSPSWPGSR